MPRTLYKSILGTDWDIVPPLIRDMHENANRAKGIANVKRGKSCLAKLIALSARLPNEGKNQELISTFESIEGGECWTRSFNGNTFKTDMLIEPKADFPCLAERFGPYLFWMELVPHEKGIDLTPHSVFLWGIKLPRFLSPQAYGFERIKNDKYSLNVRVTFPFAGQILVYCGTIERDM